MSRRLSKDWDQKSPEEYRDQQIRQLRTFLREQVLPFSPYYQKAFAEAGLSVDAIRSHDDLAKIPFCNKEMIAPTAEDPQRPRQLFLHPNPDSIRAHWPLSKKLPLLWKKMTQGADAVKESLGEEYRPVSVFFTTGRSALPTAFLLTRYDLDILEEVGRRIVQVAKINSPDDKVLSVFPYAPHLAFWQVYYCGVGADDYTLLDMIYFITFY